MQISLERIKNKLPPRARENALFLCTRVGTVYLLFFLMFHMIVDEHKLDTKALNHLMLPSLDYLLELEQRQGKDPDFTIDKRELRRYTDYYEKVVRHVAKRADAYAMLGFCYYHLKDEKKALFSYKEALNLNPQYFGFHYNLGVIHFKQRRYRQAIDALKKAADADLPNDLNFITTSKIYFPIFADPMQADRELKERFKAGYYNAYVLLILSYYHEGNFERMFHYSRLAAALGLDEEGIFDYYSGLAAQRLNKHREAVYFFRKCVKGNFHHADIYYSMGLSLRVLGKEQLAQQTLRQGRLASGREESLMQKGKKIEPMIF